MQTVQTWLVVINVHVKLDIRVMGLLVKVTDFKKLKTLNAHLLVPELRNSKHALQNVYKFSASFQNANSRNDRLHTFPLIFL